MNRQDKIKALELEIRGIDTELKEALMLHRSLTVKIDYLENIKTKLKIRLSAERQFIFRSAPRSIP